jgi:predicted component of type VI protein secretion system
MTITEQADALIDKYRPYADNEGLEHSITIQTRNATQCTILEVEARIKELKDFIGGHIADRVYVLINILNELKSRL